MNSNASIGEEIDNTEVADKKTRFKIPVGWLVLGIVLGGLTVSLGVKNNPNYVHVPEGFQKLGTNSAVVYDFGAGEWVRNPSSWEKTLSLVYSPAKQGWINRPVRVSLNNWDKKAAGIGLVHVGSNLSLPVTYEKDGNGATVCGVSPVGVSEKYCFHVTGPRDIVMVEW